MNPQDAAEDVIRRTENYLSQIQGTKPSSIAIRIPVYDKSEDLNYFKGPQAITLEEYKAAVEALQSLCEKKKWFLESDSITAAEFKEWIDFKRSTPNVASPRVEFVFNKLGYPIQSSATLQPLGLSPFVVMTDTKPDIHGLVIEDVR